MTIYLERKYVDASHRCLTILVPSHWVEMTALGTTSGFSITNTITWGLVPFLERQIAKTFIPRPFMTIKMVEDQAMVSGDDALIVWLIQQLGYTHSICSPDDIPDDAFEDIDSDVIVAPHSGETLEIHARNPETITLLAVKFPEMWR